MQLVDFFAVNTGPICTPFKFNLVEFADLPYLYVQRLDRGVQGFNSFLQLLAIVLVVCIHICQRR